MGTVVVCGPPACGKTRNSGHLLRMFGAAAVVDGWDAKRHRLEPDCVHLTTLSREAVQRAGVSCKIVNFTDLKLPIDAQRADYMAFHHPQSKRWSSSAPAKPYLLEGRLGAGCA